MEVGLTFVDALKRFGKDLRAEDLEQAYTRAGTSFAGQMQQTFVVLHETITQGRMNAQKVRESKLKMEVAKSLKRKSEAGRSDTSSGFRSGFGSGAKLPRRAK